MSHYCTALLILIAQTADKAFRILHLVYTDYEEAAISHSLKHILLSDCVDFDDRQLHPLQLLLFMILELNINLSTLGLDLRAPVSDFAISSLRGWARLRSQTAARAAAADLSSASGAFNSLAGTNQVRLRNFLFWTMLTSI